MVNPWNRRIVCEESESEKESVGAPQISPRKRPLVVDDSDSGSDDVSPTTTHKRVRCVVLDDDEDEEDNESDPSNLPATSQLPEKGRDHELLLSSLAVSQKASPSKLPTLPTEVLLTVLDNADPADVLDHRLVCKAFKEVIDTSVLYYHIQRVELIGYLGPKECQLMEQLNAQDYWDLAFVNAIFERLDERVGNRAVWDPQSAYFRINESWYDTFVRSVGEIEPDNPWWHHTVQCLDLRKPSSVHGQLRWCVKVGPTVVDFGMADKQDVNIELVEREDEDTIIVRVTNWKRMLTNVFREERALNLLLKDTEEDEFTYSHLEDGLRDIRRKRYRSKLDPRNNKHGRDIWKMDNMNPLWGKYSSMTVIRDYEDVELAERNAVQTLMLLRREDSMSSRERDALYTMKEERAIMHREVAEVDEQFKKWQESLLGLPNLSLGRIETDHDVDPNPMTWSKEVVDRESQNLIRWKAQKQTTAHIKAYLDATNAAATLAEYDFDDEDKDF